MNISYTLCQHHQGASRLVYFPIGLLYNLGFEFQVGSTKNRPSDVRMTRRANGTDLKLATPTTALHGELEARWKEIPGFDCKKPGLSSFFCLSLYSKLK